MDALVSTLYDPEQLENFCRALSLAQTAHALRVVACGENSRAIYHELERIKNNAALPSVSYATARSDEIVFVFTGLGSEWWGMARDLLHLEPVFEATLVHCDSIIQCLTGWSLLFELSREQAVSRIGQTTFAQPALLAIQIALVSLWRAWGIESSAVVGHSAGDIAAAFTADVLTLEDALTIACHRGRLMDRDSSRGGMLAVAMSVDELEELLPDIGGGIELAAINGPLSCTVSGDRDAIVRFAEHVKKGHIPVKQLNIDYAYHSHKQDPIKLELLQSLELIHPKKATKPLYSSVTGDYSSGETWDSNYWWRNSRDTVYFAPAVHQLIKRGYRIFLEIGPHASLLGSVKDCLREHNVDGLVLPSMRKGEHDQLVMYNTLGELYCRGFDVNWRGVYPLSTDAAG